MPIYLARVEPSGPIRVYRVVGNREVLRDSIPLATGAGLRQTLRAAGWQPTGRKARGGWGAVFVTPVEDGTHPTRS